MILVAGNPTKHYTSYDFEFWDTETMIKVHEENGVTSPQECFRRVGIKLGKPIFNFNHTKGFSLLNPVPPTGSPEPQQPAKT